MSLDAWEDLLSWYRTNMRPTTGRLPAVNTVRCKASRLTRAADIMGTPQGDAQALVCALSTREGVDRLLDGLAERVSTGSAASIVDAVSTLNAWGQTQGLPPIPLTK